MGKLIGVAIAAGLLAGAAAGGAARASYSGTNGSIVFVDASGALAVYAPGTHAVARLLAPAASNLPLAGPTWAPDGRSIAYIQRGPDANESTATVQIRFAGGGTISSLGIWDYVTMPAPSWTPDSASLFGDGQQTRADGTGYQRLAAFGGVASPTLSPDGQRVVYASNTGHAIEVANLDGTNAHTIAPWDGAACGQHPRYSADELAFSWSPDGTRVAYCDRFALVVANADGSGTTSLVSGIVDGRVSWSPDGAQLVYPTDAIGHTQGALQTVDADGSNPQFLHDTHGDDVVGVDPDWGRTPPSPPDAHGPTPLGPPAVEGTPAYGKGLVGQPGDWGGDPVRLYTYEWQRCTATGDGCTDVATSVGGPAYYNPQAADIGHRLRLVVTATTAGGQGGQTALTDVVARGTYPGTTSSSPPPPPAPTTPPPAPVVVVPSLDIRSAHAAWTKTGVRVRLTACGAQGRATLYATDWNVVGGHAQARHRHSWPIAGTATCRTTVRAWKVARGPGHTIALRVHDAAGRWSRPVLMRLR